MNLTYAAAAQNDLHQIASYTIERWGAAQADRYLATLEDCCELASQNVYLGRPHYGAVKNLRCLNQGKHVITMCRKSPVF